jgi:hypothetical protein
MLPDVAIIIITKPHPDSNGTIFKPSVLYGVRWYDGKSWITHDEWRLHSWEAEVIRQRIKKANTLPAELGSN